MNEAQKELLSTVTAQLKGLRLQVEDIMDEVGAAAFDKFDTKRVVLELSVAANCLGHAVERLGQVGEWKKEGK